MPTIYVRKGLPVPPGRRRPEAIAWTVCQYTGVSASPGAAGRLVAANPLSALVTRRSGRLSRWLRGAAAPAAISWPRGSSSRGTPGQYAPRPATARRLPCRRVGPQGEQLVRPALPVPACRHAAWPSRYRGTLRRRPSQHCPDPPGCVRAVTHGCSPAFRARPSILAVPADVGACLPAVRYQEGQWERDAAHGALGGLQRPEVPLGGCRPFRQDQIRTGRALLRSRFLRCRHNC